MNILHTDNQAGSAITETFKVLPKKLPIKKLGKEHKKLEGYVKITEFSRLNNVILFDNIPEHENSNILISINFIDLGFNRIAVESEINHVVLVKCQRCMRIMSYDIIAKINLVLVKDFEDISGKFSSYEQIPMDNNELVDLYQLLEDEMILSLPVVIKHDDTNKECVKFSDFFI